MNVLNKKNITGSVNRDLNRFSKISSVAYLVATLVLCGTIIFSYYTLKRILVEQSHLNAFELSNNQLRITIQESSLYLSDLKQAREQKESESRLEQKVNHRLQSALVNIYELKTRTSQHLENLRDYTYYDEFFNMFNGPPDNIWQKLDQYVARLQEVSANGSGETAGAGLLWLPVEATAAKNGALGKSYQTALLDLQSIATERADHLATTHKNLSLISILIVLLELALIFIPLRRQLRKVNLNLQSAHKKLYLQANYDQQTGFPNTSGISKQLRSADSEKPYNSLIIVSIFDIENISNIVGPTLLDNFFKNFSHKLSQTFPEDSLIFRTGDNEFGIISHSSVSNTSSDYIESLQNKMAGKLSVQNAIIYPEFKLGSTTGRIHNENLQEKLIDARLSAQHYKPAEPVLPVYAPTMRSKIEEDSQQIERIRAGIKNNEFVPFYQIKVDSQTGLICGMEALCRWIDSDGTMHSPFSFIPLAEKSGLISEMTWQLLDTIANDYKKWCELGLSPGRVAFNAAELMLREGDFPERIKRILEKTGAEHCPIDLEITENVTLGAESDNISRSLAAAHDLGMKLALDDFGTGFASLSSIVSMDIDIIKVDQSFVRMISTSNDARNIVASIIKLCQQLEKKCVVEGVETEEEWEFCRELGCDEIQGYFFYKPAPFDSVVESLQHEQQLKEAS